MFRSFPHSLKHKVQLKTGKPQVSGRLSKEKIGALGKIANEAGEIDIGVGKEGEEGRKKKNILYVFVIFMSLLFLRLE